MRSQPFIEILEQIRSTRFRDLAGARISGTVPVSERLINELVAGSLKQGGPIREVRVHPLPGNAFSVRLTPRAALLPSITVRIEIERQPELPSSPVLGLRIATMGGLLGFAGSALPIAHLLPTGVRLEADRILVDLHGMALNAGVADVLEYLTSLEVNTQEGRLVVNVRFDVR